MTHEEVLSLIDGFKEEIERSSDSGAAGFNWYFTTDEARMIVRILTSYTELSLDFKHISENQIENFNENLILKYQEIKKGYKDMSALCSEIEPRMNGIGFNDGLIRLEIRADRCPFEFLKCQEETLGQYLRYLEILAELDGIDLT